MRSCKICGKSEALPFQCSYCGGIFCSDHRLPEYHECPGLEAGVVKSPVEKRKLEAEKRHKIPVRRRRGIKLRFPKTGLGQYGYANIFLGVITLTFLLQNVVPGFTRVFVLDPLNVLIKPWGLVTSIFLHANFAHFFVNGIVLLFFGNELERRVGSRKFIEIFLLAGIIGNLGYLIFTVLTGLPTPALGASGALYGIFAVLAIIAPEIRVMLFFILPLNIRSALLLFALYDLLTLPITSITGIASAAHLAGLLVGLYYGKKLKYTIYPTYGTRF